MIFALMLYLLKCYNNTVIFALMLYWMCGVGMEHWAQPDEQCVTRGPGCREPKRFGV